MTVDELMRLLEGTAGFEENEDVDLLTHSLQCAERLAELHPDDIELQAAGLVHDVGHVGAPDDPARHDAVGAAMVRDLLGDRVAWLVKHHVVAKRYLVTTDAEYRARLSPRSIETLRLQGGEMPASEVAELEADSNLGAAVELRRADDDAKDPSTTPRPLSTWRPVIEAVADRHAGNEH